MHKVLNVCIAIKMRKVGYVKKKRRSTAILRLLTLNEISTSELCKHIKQIKCRQTYLDLNKLNFIIQSNLF